MNPYNYAKPNKMVAGTIEVKRPKMTKNSAKAKQEAYLSQKIMNAKPEELTLMLYEGLVRFIKLAEYYVEKKDIEKTNENSKRAQDIVDELKATLNRDVEISAQLESLYDFIESELLEGNIKKELVHFKNARELSEELCNTWKQIVAR